MSDWKDLIVGARMTVDQEFAQRVAESQFSRQQWNLVMTAVEFEVESPGDPERARIVADTSKLPAVMPELDEIDAAMGGPGAGGPDRSAGLLDGIKNLLGGGGGDDDRKAAAEALAQEYAAELQAHLESTGRWEDVRAAAE